VRRAKIRPSAPWREGSVRGDGWNCEVCEAKPYRHQASYPHEGSYAGSYGTRCSGYVNEAAQRILGWW